MKKTPDKKKPKPTKAVKKTKKTATKKKVIKRLRKSDTLVPDTIVALMTTTTQAEAAKALKISRVALYKRMVNHPEIRESIKNAKDTARDILVQATPKAAEVIVKSMDSKKLKYEAAKEILDRTGVGESTKNNNTQVNIVNAVGQQRKQFDL